MTTETTKRYTLKEAGAYLGVSPNTLRFQMDAGKIERATPKRQGVPVLFTQEALDAYDARRKAHQANVRASRPDRQGRKRCTGCKNRLPVSEFHRCPSAKSGLQSRCRACQKAIDASRRADDPDLEKRKHRRWYERNRAYAMQRSREVRLEGYAVRDGISSPVTRKTGFFVAVAPDETVRAARADKPLLPGEKQIALFECVAGSWIATLPTVLAPAYEHRARLLVKRWQKLNEEATP